MKRLPVAAGLVGGMILAIVGAGCSATSLSHDEQNQMLMAKDRRLQEELHAAQEKIASLTASGVQPRAAAAMPADPFHAVAVRISPLSGVVDAGRTPADQRLRVILEPLDATGDVVKRAGSLELEAFEQAPAASPAPGATAGERLYRLWTFSADDLAETWLSGLGTYAYVLKLPWPDARPPADQVLRLKARLKTLSGQVLQTEMEIPLRAPAATK
ncbi:MAG: hypothetical protein NT049_04620 [Planctomycetota bacterium]|nr:hypothetical protein [Planctomycetota bacterium]